MSRPDKLLSILDLRAWQGATNSLFLSPATEEGAAMALPYGFVKCRIISEPQLQSSQLSNEVQYHLHVKLQVSTGQGGAFKTWDTAINVGTNDADDLLKYKIVFDFQHKLIQTLKLAAGGFHDLTNTKALPALDFLRSDVLAQTGGWRDSDVLDGTDFPEPVASLKRLLQRAHAKSADVYVFGRTYKGGDLGIHDVHMNQGSQSAKYLNNGHDDHNDHNDTWQDGAVVVDFGDPQWAGYFTSFTQQLVPTDDLGNPDANSLPISNSGPGNIVNH
jgi:hypothetical protein